jgi:hypothetical protein
VFHRLSILALLVVFITADASAQNRLHRRRGALLGGLAGAAIGAAIGDKGDNETAGALIGGAVGAIAGGTIGNQKDQRIEHNMQYHSGSQYYNGQSHYVGPTYPHGHPQYVQPGYTYPQQPYPQYRQPNYPETLHVPPTDAPISPDDVVAMTQSGLSDAMIIQQIQMKGVTQRLTVSDVIQLHRLGVREPVISAMQGVSSEMVPGTVGDPKNQGQYPIDGTSYRVPTTTEQIYGPSVLNAP